MYSSPYTNASPYYADYDTRNPATTQYYPPRYSVYNTAPKTHARRATEDYGYYSTPKATYYYASPETETPRRTSSQRKPNPVSGFDHPRTKTTTRRYVVHPTDNGHNASRHRVSEEQDPYRSSRYASNGGYADYRSKEEYQEYLSAYDRKYRTSPPPPEERYQYTSYRDPRANYQTYYDQGRGYQYEESPSHKRPRRASQPSKPTQPPPKPATKPPPKKATDADARDAGIPAGFSIKHWDPNEEPILLLGSVFDANSLGKWIYDWTVATHGPATPLTEVAGDLWLLLIQLAGKIKRAEKCLPRIRYEDDYELVEDFIESGERLWSRFNKLLKICEQFMLKNAKRDKTTKKVVMGKNSGCEFVDCIFGRDRELQRTEKIMASIRLWSMRFDANCQDILRNPSA